MVIVQDSANTRMEMKRQNTSKVLMMSGAALHCPTSCGKDCQRQYTSRSNDIRLAGTQHHHRGPASVQEQVGTWDMPAVVAVELEFVVEAWDDTALPVGSLVVPG